MIFTVKKSYFAKLRRVLKFFGGQSALLIILSTIIFAGVSSPANGTLDPTFTGGVTEAKAQVYTSAQLPDGKILVGGNYNFANGAERGGLTRLNADGSLDASFNAGGAGANGSVYEIILLANGKFLIGGGFTLYNGTAKGSIVRLNADGSLDASFNAGGVGAVGTVQTIALQTDGKILISGSPTSYNGTARFSVIRLNADGSLDTSFTSPFTSSQFVEEVDVLPTGKIIIGGGFSVGSPERIGIARLNADGSLDTTFNPSGGGVDTSVYAVKVQADGKILIGGDFTEYQNFSVSGIARLTPDGDFDFTFNPPPSNGGSSIEYFDIQSDGKILVAGKFDNFPSYGLYRLNANGTFDVSFTVGQVDATGYHVAIQADGKIILTGYFNRYAGQSRRNIIRLNSNGIIDETFTASFANFGAINSIARQPDGKIIVAGNFNIANSAARNNIARFNTDGTLDTTFAADPGTSADSANSLNTISVVVVQPDGKILIGGYFSGYNGALRRSVARLNADGTLDTSFNSSYFSTPPSAVAPIINDILVLPNGQLLVGGYFFQPTDVTIQGIVRLNANGSLDTALAPIGSNSSVLRLIRQPDGKILVGGAFTSFYFQNRFRLARLNADLSLDSTFNAGSGANATVQNIALQPDGKIIIGGNFTTFNGVSRSRVARLNADSTLDSAFNPGAGATNGNILAVALQNDGKIIIGGAFTTYNNSTSNRLARLNPDGSFDASFVSGFDNDPRFFVRRLLLQDDGKLLVGGTFKSYNGVPRNSLLRLSTAAPRPTAFDFDGDGRADLSVFRPSNGTWYLQQSSAGFAALNFGQNGDAIVPADYDGDGKTDVAVFRNGVWYIQRSQLGFVSVSFGTANDVPQPSDFSGDGKAELAVFRPSNGSWYVLNLANNQFNAVQFGQSGDQAVVGDYDGDGRADYAVYRSGIWYVQRSSLGFFNVSFGAADDKPSPADFDGDGTTDFAVFRPSNGTWYLQRSRDGFNGIAFGAAGDLPAAADYDGDGKADVAVFRNGTWYLNRTTQGFTGIAFGAAGDKPTPNAFVQ